MMGDSTCEKDGVEVVLFFDDSGTAEFTLKDGQTLTVDNLPNGTAYTVTELEANQDGYTTRVSGSASGTISGQQTAVVEFENYKPGGGGGSTPTPSPSGSPNPSGSPEPSGSPNPSGSPSPSGSPNPSGSPGPSGTPAPGTTPAPDGTTPPSEGDPDDTPSTGDPTHTGVWIALGAVSLAALGGLWLTRPKGKRPRHLRK